MKAVTLVPWASRAGGGLFDAARNLTLALQDNGISMDVVSLEDAFTKNDAPLWCPLAPKIVSIKGPRIFGYAPAMLNELLSSNAEVIHCHGIWQYHTIACWRWHSRTRRPYLVSPHGNLDPGDLTKSTWKKRLARLMYQGRHFGRAACIHALCQGEAEAIRAYGIKNRIVIIPNGVHVPYRVEADSQERAADANGQFVLLYLGRITPRKGLPMLLEAWSRLKNQNAQGLGDWRLEIAGWQQYGHEAALEARARALGLRDSVRFVGSKFGEEKERSFRSAHAFVLPSLSEGLPLAVLEAWSYSLPVLMTPRCNLTEGFKCNAAISAESTVEGIASGLRQLVAMSPAERAIMGARGRRLVEERFRWSIVAAKMRAVYEWVAGGGSVPECAMAS